jgi:acetate---CoA ligase (ADP-forming)
LARLDPLLRPRSVVVVGASPNPSFVSSILKNLLQSGFGGRVAAVNPRYESILDAACYPSVLDVPWPIDLAVVGVSWRQFPLLLEQCERKRVGALVVITSGFAESGGEGIRRQADLSAWAERTGTPVGGPNCLGLLHAPTGLHALPSTFPRLVEGQVGLVLQSGMMAPSVLTPLFARNIGVTFAVTSGNEADVDLAEYIRYFVDDEQTRVIGCFAEQIKRPQAFIAACELAAEAAKPIAMLKIGRSEAAQRAALAHTGSLVGADAVIDAALEKVGVTRVTSVDALFEAIAAFHTRRLPRGTGLAAISVSGGAAGLLSDLAADCGVRFATLTDDTEQQLREVVPEFGNVGNPLDVTGQGVFQPELLERSLHLLAADPGVDAIVYARSFPSRIDGDSPAYHALERAIERHPHVPLLAMSLAGGHFFPAPTIETPVQRPLDRLDEVPFLQGAEYGLKAVAALMRYAAHLRDRAAPAQARLTSPEAASAARAVLRRAGGTRLSASACADVLAAYGVPCARQALATSAPDALDIAGRFGYPVAAKVEAPSLAHKAAAGGVVLNIGGPDALRAAFDRLTSLVDDAEGVLIQDMVGDGVAEVILGMSRDAQFGPVIAVGLGGVFVETLRDVQLMLPPLSRRDASRALARLRGAALLQGADVDALLDVLLRFSELCQDVGDALRAIDVNPLIVRAAGQGLTAVDALFELDVQPPESALAHSLRPSGAAPGE